MKNFERYQDGFTALTFFEVCKELIRLKLTFEIVDFTRVEEQHVRLLES